MGNGCDGSNFWYGGSGVDFWEVGTSIGDCLAKMDATDGGIVHGAVREAGEDGCWA